MMGQAGGGAIADILYGKVNPSGKLAESFPIKLIDTPAYINYPGENGKVRYGEGIFIGYRYYDAKEIPVQFPFGFGMSYTTFTYTNPKVSAVSFRDVDGLTVAVDVTNTGKLAGKEIVQLYVHDHASSIVRPPKELKGFAKVELQPGETKTVSLKLDLRAFAYYHPAYQQWVTEDGDFDILIGASSTDIRCVLTVSLQSTNKLPSLLKRLSTVREWMEDQRGKNVLCSFLLKQPAKIQSGFGGVKADGIGLDPKNFVMDMPLPNKFHEYEDLLPSSPEDVVDGLLAKLRATDR